MIQEHAVSLGKTEETSRFATLDLQLQLQIKHYLELGDFRSAKMLFDGATPQARGKSDK